METNGGATTSFGYEVHVGERGQSPTSAIREASLYGAVRSDKASGVNLRWDSASQLSIEYWYARSAEVGSPNFPIAGRLISVGLEPGVRDETAPPGGMLFNRQRSRKR